MSQNERANDNVPGWVILSSRAVPDIWRSWAIPMMLVPLTPTETDELLSDAPIDQALAAADVPLAQLVARGHSAAQVARSLGLSERTVYRHVARLNDEFGVSTIQELATELARRGF